MSEKLKNIIGDVVISPDRPSVTKDSISPKTRRYLEELAKGRENILRTGFMEKMDKESWETLQKNSQSLEQYRYNLIAANMPAAARLVSGFMGRCKITEQVSYDDLLSECFLAMKESAQRYDPTWGSKFISYASISMFGNMIDYIYNHARQVKIPKSEIEKIIKEGKFSIDWLFMPLDQPLPERYPESLSKIDRFPDIEDPDGLNFAKMIDKSMLAPEELFKRLLEMPSFNQREKDVLQILIDGYQKNKEYTNKEIADIDAKKRVLKKPCTPENIRATKVRLFKRIELSPYFRKYRRKILN